METRLSPSARALLLDSWRLTPARMAEHLTGGGCRRYAHARFLETKIAQKVGRGGARLLITLPPRHGKSWLASLFTPAWFLSLWPERNVILAARDAGLALEWGQGVRALLRRHEGLLGIALTGGAGAGAQPRWTTARGGGFAATGVGAPVDGRGGGHLLIVDDPVGRWADASQESFLRRQTEWFNSTLYPRAEPGASIVVIMTRWHERDLAGYLQAEHGDAWETLRLPALAEEGDPLGRPVGAALCEERYGHGALQQIRNSVGARVWNAQYQQRPDADAGVILRREWWRYYLEPPRVLDEVIQSWDVAFKGGESSDYVVGQVWGRVGERKFLLDQVRARMDFPATLRAVRQLSEKYPQARKKLVEDKANGSALVASLEGSIPGLVLVQPDAGKKTRVSAVAGEIESGNVYLPAPARAPWVEEFLCECSGFPDGVHDDQVDAMAYALRSLREGAR